MWVNRISRFVRFRLHASMVHFAHGGLYRSVFSLASARWPSLILLGPLPGRCKAYIFKESMEGIRVAFAHRSLGIERCDTHSG